MITIKLVVPDVDGMLLTSERFSDAFPRVYGVDKAKIDAFFKEEFGDCVKGKKDLKKLLAVYLPKWKPGMSVEDALKFWFDLYHENQPVIDELKKYRLQGLKIVLGTNIERYRLDNILKERGFGQWADGVVASCEIGIKKPAPEFYQVLEKKFPTVKKSEILIFDDKEEHIEQLKKLGYNAERYEDFPGFQQLFKQKYSILRN